jgi:hypothetical protein
MAKAYSPEELAQRVFATTIGFIAMILLGIGVVMATRL